MPIISHSLTNYYCKQDLVFYSTAIYIHPPKFGQKMVLKS